MILIEDTHGVVHVAQPSTDAIHWMRCGATMSGDGVEHPLAMGSTHAGRYVDRAPTCLLCVRKRWLVAFHAYQEIGIAVGNVGVIPCIDFLHEDA